MMINKFLVIMFAIYLVGCSSPNETNIGQIGIYWPKEKEFIQRAESSIFSPEEALEILYKWKKNNESQMATFDTPQLIMGDYYYFAPLKKIMGPPTGYYIHRNTGRLEFRTSEHNIKNPKGTPIDIFTSIEILQEGNENTPKE